MGTDLKSLYYAVMLKKTKVKFPRSRSVNHSSYTVSIRLSQKWATDPLALVLTVTLKAKNKKLSVPVQEEKCTL